MKPIVFDSGAAWEASGLSLGAFEQLVRDLEAAGKAHRGRGVVVFANMKAAQLVLGCGCGRRSARRSGGAR